MYANAKQKIPKYLDKHWYFFPAFFFTVKAGDALTTFVALNFYTTFQEQNPVARLIFETIGLIPGLTLLLIGGTIFVTVSVEAIVNITDFPKIYNSAIRLSGYLPITLISFYYAVSNLLKLAL